MLPALAFYLVFVVYPVGASFYYSTLEWSGIGEATYVGLQNFSRLLGDEMVWRSLSHNLILVIASLVVQLPIGLGLAMLLMSKVKGVRLFRTVYFMPLLMSTVAIGILWTSIYNPTFGIINRTLELVGLESWQQGWLGNEGTALLSVIAVICWQFIPFYMILFRAALVGLPEAIYDAAKVDGASNWESFRFITLPLLKGTIRTAALLSLVGSLKYFDLIWIMTGGGPSGSTELVTTYMVKQAFNRFNVGYGSAIAVLLFVISFSLTALVVLRSQRREAEAWS